MNPFSIALALIIIGIFYRCARRGQLNWVRLGFDIVPDNSDYPIDGHTAVKSALAVWKAKHELNRAEKAQKRELTCHAARQLEVMPEPQATAALLADKGLVNTQVETVCAGTLESGAAGDGARA